MRLPPAYAGGNQENIFCVTFTFWQDLFKMLRAYFIVTITCHYARRRLHVLSASKEGIVPT
ncbi:hypothetical protein Xinn_00732 [Xenorhabdus innexi]|uniref:Transposase n=1 Tax=Xenorhabdus innexi TaxID=290109 RepID=A0A2G0NT48_9GAMM|nr:hypothetical protein Xinn_00732 [Xenorhabdus innexi]